MRFRLVARGAMSIAACFAIGFSSRAESAPRTCESVFSKTTSGISRASAIAKFEKELDQDARDPWGHYSAWTKTQPEPTVMNAGRFEGPLGGYVHRAERKAGESWMSSYSPLMVGTYAVDSQGDVRKSLISFGYDLAKILGVEVEDENTLLLSDAAETMARVSAFNTYLVRHGIEPLALGFYTEAHSLPLRLRLENYLSRFETFGELPVASPDTEWATFLHDISFHRHVAVAPSELAALLKTIVHANLAYFKFADAYFQKTLSKEDAALASRALLVTFSQGLDFSNSRVFYTEPFELVYDARYAKRKTGGPARPGRLRPLRIPNANPFRKDDEQTIQLELGKYLRFQSEWVWQNDLTAYELEPIELATITPGHIIRHGLRLLHETSTSEDKAYQDYVFGIGKGLGPQAARLRESQVWTRALVGFAASYQGGDLEKPFFSSKDDLYRLTRNMKNRRIVLKRAARDYFAEEQTKALYDKN